LRRKSQTFRCDKDITAADHRHEQRRNQRYQITKAGSSSPPCAGEELCSIGRPVVVRRTKRVGLSSPSERGLGGAPASHRTFIVSYRTLYIHSIYPVILKQTIKTYNYEL
jgi:hypothetical protein